MLAVVPRTGSTIDSIAIDIWAGRAGLPRQRQCGCSRRPLEEEPGGKQHSCCKDGPVQDSAAN
jgi:hypothetical protein